MKNKPNFFIVGAPKCGTTALSEYLRSHPNIFLTRPKEPHFFAEDFYRPIKTIEDYTALFRGVSNNHIAIGEGSATYLLSKVAVKNIKKFVPDAKLIVLVRNPIEMIPSLHSQLFISFDETVEDFEAAWKLQSERSRGECIPKNCRFPAYLQYAYAGRLGAQLERLFHEYDTNLIKVIVFDDFVRSTKNVYEETLAFLAVPSDERVDFPRLKANRRSRSRRVSRYIWRPPKLLVNTYLSIKKSLNLGSLGLISRAKNIASQQTNRKNISQDMKQELVKTFRDDVLLLSDLLKRDLTYWLEV